MPITIKHLDGRVLMTLEAETFAHADLRGKNLQRADFRGLTLHGPNPQIPERNEGAVFDHADLRDADFRNSDIRFTLFRGANLADAKFDGARLNWCSHDLTSEIFRQASGNDPQKLEVAQINLAHPEWAYRQFSELNHPQWGWAMSVLRGFIQPDDRLDPNVATYIAERAKGRPVELTEPVVKITWFPWVRASEPGLTP